MKTNIKKRMLRISILTAVLLVYVVSFSQANTMIKGRILDCQYKPVEYATATIISPDSSNIIKGDMCNDAGEFFIEDIEPGEYILSVRQVGFQKNETYRIKITGNNLIVNINNIIMNEANILLNELEVIPKSVKNKKRE